MTNKHKQKKTTDVAPLRLWSRIQSALALKTKRKHKDKHDKLILFEGSEALFRATDFHLGHTVY